MSDVTTTMELQFQPSADETIAACMDPEKPRSFFLYAGAGSGKTRALVASLDGFRGSHGRRFNISGRKVGVITYTNAARDEIERRIGLDALFHVSTIHSFCWSLIRGFNTDIRGWLKSKLETDIGELETSQIKRRPGTKAAQDRERSISSKKARLERLDSIRVFSYSPNGDNFGRDSLSHAEVLQITSAFLQQKPLMRLLLINRFPLLLIDESQDTNAGLIDGLFAVEREHHGKFALGLFGDMMQRIYSDGKHNLGHDLPEDWEKPAKRVNHRSAKRIVKLGNSLRRDIDDHQQISPDDKSDGDVRLFVTLAGLDNKQDVEESVMKVMAGITDDDGWLSTGEFTKLALEHHMAANRLGFADLWQTLYAQDHLKRGLIDGDRPEIRLFSERVLPVINAAAADDRFAVAEIIKRHSPLLDRKQLTASSDQRSQIEKARAAVNALTTLIRANEQVTFLEVLRCITEHGLFEIPDQLIPFAEPDSDEFADDGEQEESVLQAWRQCLETPFFQIVPYSKYISDSRDFDTHHGVKGLEFNRVIVLLDDAGTRGFMYSYEKLLGVVPPSATDTKNKDEGKDTSLARTRRLLYVACTRAKDSLAILVYTSNPDGVRSHAIDKGWFGADEIVTI